MSVVQYWTMLLGYLYEPEIAILLNFSYIRESVSNSGLLDIDVSHSSHIQCVIPCPDKRRRNYFIGDYIWMSDFFDTVHNSQLTVRQKTECLADLVYGQQLCVYHYMYFSVFIYFFLKRWTFIISIDRTMSSIWNVLGEISFKIFVRTFNGLYFYLVKMQSMLIYICALFDRRIS